MLKFSNLDILLCVNFALLIMIKFIENFLVEKELPVRRDKAR